MSVFRLAIALVASLVALLGALPAVVLALPLWGVSGAVRLGGRIRSRLEPRIVPWQELIEFEPEIGWKNRPHLTAYVAAEENYRLSTDAQGWRGSVDLGECQLVVFGDSFAFGHAADDGTVFADLDTGVRMKAVGANGYSMVQELLWMERLSSQLNGKLVVWFVFYGNDLLDNLLPNFLQYRKPFVRSRDGGASWEIVSDHVAPDRWPDAAPQAYPQKLAEICSSTHLSARAFGACRYLIERARGLCWNAGADLIVIGLPAGLQRKQLATSRLAGLAVDGGTIDPMLPDRRLREICSELDVPFVALSGRLQRGDFLRDGHWTASGHRRVARILADLYHGRQPLRALQRTPRDLAPAV